MLIVHRCFQLLQSLLEGAEVRRRSAVFAEAQELHEGAGGFIHAHLASVVTNLAVDGFHEAGDILRTLQRDLDVGQRGLPQEAEAVAAISLETSGDDVGLAGAEAALAEAVDDLDGPSVGDEVIALGGGHDVGVTGDVVHGGHGKKMKDEG